MKFPIRPPDDPASVQKTVPARTLLFSGFVHVTILAFLILMDRLGFMMDPTLEVPVLGFKIHL